MESNTLTYNQIKWIHGVLTSRVIADRPALQVAHLTRDGIMFVTDGYMMARIAFGVAPSEAMNYDATTFKTWLDTHKRGDRFTFEDLKGGMRDLNTYPDAQHIFNTAYNAPHLTRARFYSDRVIDALKFMDDGATDFATSTIEIVKSAFGGPSMLISSGVRGIEVLATGCGE